MGNSSLYNPIPDVNNSISTKIGQIDPVFEPAEPKKTDLIFIDSHKPALQEGEYTLTAHQSVDVNGYKTDVLSQDFYIAGPRFAVPQQDMGTVFPPAASIGDHALVMPHISFNRVSLPWELEHRRVSAVGNGDGSHASWLALVLFDETEVPNITTAAIKDLGLQDIEFYDPETAVSLIDIKSELQPEKNTDSKYLAHIRRTILEVSKDTVKEASFVLANRLPRPNSTSTVHLVSLRDAPTGTYAGKYISLYHWTFTCLENHPAFKTLLDAANLSANVFGLNISNTTYSNIGKQGYIPMPHFLRLGEKGISIYRGPLMPYGLSSSASASAKDQPYPYDRLKWEGTLANVSYVAAFQLGQMLTVGNKGIAEAIFDWKRQMYQYQKTADHHLDGTNLPDYLIHTMKDPPPLPESVQNWLLGLSQLDNVPFNYMIPSESLIPQNSIRFFSIDNEWIKNLLEGALSIGREYFSFSHIPGFLNQPLTGFLLRSEVVSDYPQMSITAYSDKPPNTDSDPTKTVGLYFKKQLDKNLVLYYYKDKIQTLDLYLKPEVIHFGFEDDDGVKKRVRDTNGNYVGNPFVINNDIADISMEAGSIGDRIVHIDKLINTINGVTGVAKVDSSKIFALQMIEGSPKMRFTIPQ